MNDVFTYLPLVNTFLLLALLCTVLLLLWILSGFSARVARRLDKLNFDEQRLMRYYHRRYVRPLQERGHECVCTETTMCATHWPHFYLWRQGAFLREDAIEIGDEVAHFLSKLDTLPPSRTPTE